MVATPGVRPRELKKVVPWQALMLRRLPRCHQAPTGRVGSAPGVVGSDTVCGACARVGGGNVWGGARCYILAPSIPPTRTSPHQATYPLRWVCRQCHTHSAASGVTVRDTERGATENPELLDRWNIWSSPQSRKLDKAAELELERAKIVGSWRGDEVARASLHGSPAHPSPPIFGWVEYGSTGVAPPWQCVAAMRRSPVEVKLPRSWPRCLRSTSGGALGYAPACRSTAAFGGGSPSSWGDRRRSPLGRLGSVL